MIQARLPDGRILQFPDGTDPAVVQATVKRMVGQGGASPPLFTPLSESVAGSFFTNTFPALEEKRAEMADIAERGDIEDRPFHAEPPRQPAPPPSLQPSHTPSPLAAKRAEVEEIRETGDLGTEDFTDAAEPGWMPEYSKQGISQRSLRDTVLDRGFGWAIGGVERAGLLPEGTRAAVRENQQESLDRMLTAHPEGGLGRAAYLALGDVGASIAGPQALLGPGVGALAGRGAAALGAGAGLRTAVGFAGGALEGAGQAALDVIDLPPEERGRMVALGAGMGGLGAVRAVRAEARHAAAPKLPPPEVRQQLLSAFELDKSLVAERAAAAGDPKVVAKAVGEIEAKWQPEFAQGGAAGDPVMAQLADRLQGHVAPEVKAPPPVEAMAHAGSDVSPEAISRVARGERYVRISPGGEVVPILNDVAAVDVRVNPGEVKVVVGADGVPRVEQGRPNAAQQRALGRLQVEPQAVKAAPLRGPEAGEPTVYDIPEVVDPETLALAGMRRTGSRTGSATTERGTRIDFDYELREAPDLLTSHDELMRPNPLYPPEIQPRDRTRLTSETQVGRIERQLNPELLGESPLASHGAPIIGEDGIVESGNARSLALKRAYGSGGPAGDSYRTWLQENAPRFGMDPAEVDAFRQPVLVRVRKTAVDRAAFAAEANEAPLAAMSSPEQAAADARRITAGMLETLRIPESGEVNLQTNRDFIRAFAQQVSPNEQAAMFDARGQISVEGLRRIQNAVLAKAYGNPDALAKIVEHADNNVRGVGNALLRGAPRFAQLREAMSQGNLHPLDISEDIGLAVRKLSALRETGTKVPDYLAQQDLFGAEMTEESRALLGIFDANARSSVRMADVLNRYADLVESLGHPQQAGLFGQQRVPSPLELIREAAATSVSQASMFGSAEAGFLRLGRNKPPAPPPSPIETVMPRNEPTPAPAGPLGRLQAVADRVTDQWFNREDAPVRRLRRAGLIREAKYLEDMQARARGAGGMQDPQRQAGPVYEGTYVFDPNLDGPGKFGSRRTGDGLQAIVGGMDDQALYDLDGLLAARRHMELVSRQERAQLQYDWQRAQRLEALRQARQADKISLRSMAGDIRGKQAQALQAARQEARAAGEYRAFLTGEGRLRRATPLRRHLAPAEASTDLAARRLGTAGAPAAQTRTDALAAIRSGQRVAMGIRDAATRRIPPVERPPDIDLNIDPRGTSAAQQTLADLEARYGTEPHPATGAPQIRQLDALAERFRDWTVRAWMIPLKEAGRFSDAEFTYHQNPDGSFTYGGDIIAKNDLYAPFQRLMEVLGDEDVYGLSPVTSGKPNPVHAITGGLSPDAPVARPVQSAVELAQKATLWVERQRVRNLFGDAVDSTPELQLEVKKLSPQGGAGTGPKTGLPIHVRGDFPVWRDGVRTNYTAPPDVLRAVETLSPKQAKPIMEAAKLAARMLRAGATITLEFPFRNLGRDVQDAAVYGPGYNPALKILVDPFAGLLEVLGQGKWAREWRANGGALSGAVAVGRPQIEATLRDVARGRPASLGAKIGRRYRGEIGGEFSTALKERPTTTLMKTGLFPFMAPMEALAEQLESATKVGAYRRMRLRGMSPGEAVTVSRDVSSPDFGRAGSTGQVWNQVESFSNAELQDLYRLGRAFRRNPGTTTIKALTYLTLPAIANWYKNKDDKQYQALPEWERVAFYHPVKLDAGRWVRVPRPLGLINLAWSYGPQKLLEKMAGDDPDAIEELGRAFVHGTPLHYLPQMENLRGGGRMDWVPTIAQPLAEVAGGPAGWSSFREAPIDTTAMFPDAAPLPEDRVRDRTSGIARAAGKALNVSPIKVDYLLQGYGAFWGRTLAQATGPLARGLGADPAQDTLAGRMAQGGSPQLPTTAADIPGVRGFVSSQAIGFGSDPVTKLYTLSTEAAQAKKSMKDARDAGDINRYLALMREHPEIGLADVLYADRKYLSEIRKRRNEILNSPGLDPEQREDLLISLDQLVSAYAGARLHGYSDILHDMREGK